MHPSKYLVVNDKKWPRQEVICSRSSCTQELSQHTYAQGQFKWTIFEEHGHV